MPPPAAAQPVISSANAGSSTGLKLSISLSKKSPSAANSAEQQSVVEQLPDGEFDDDDEYEDEDEDEEYYEEE